MKRGWRKYILLLCLYIGIMGCPAWMDAVRAVAAEEKSAVTVQAEEPYQKQSFISLYQDGALKMESGMDASSVKVNSSVGGILLTAMPDDLTRGRLAIHKIFDFNRNPVGRISVDGLTSVRTSLSVGVYLDDAAEPVAVIPLRRQKRAGKWTYDGDVTADVSGKNLRGRHKVALGFETEYKGQLTFLLRSVEFVEQSLPVVWFDIDESQGSIDAMNNDPEHETECYGSMKIQIPSGYRSEYTAGVLSTQTYELEYIRGRGNSTWMEKKKPYKIKLEKKADLFGMGKNKHWVLLANRFDNSKLRNKMTYWLGTAMGMPYTPESVPVDVVMNGTYCGSYYLSEQVRVGKSRVEIEDLEDNEELKNSTSPDIISGGYLLSMEPGGKDQAKTFTTTRGNRFLLERPSFEDYENEVQYNYIRDYVQHTEDAIYGEGFRDADGKSYADWMDVDAAVDYYWIQEFSMNGDAFTSGSTFLYKPRYGKLYWGPLWDFDYVAWGDYDYGEVPEVEGFVQRNSSWFDRLLEDRTFAQKVVSRWPVLKARLQDLIRDGGPLDRYYEELIISDRYDKEKWGSYDFEQKEALTLKQEEQRLKNWIIRRMDWVDQNTALLIPEEYSITFLLDGRVYTTETVNSLKGITAIPAYPKKKGYLFGGWYVKEDGDEYKLMVGQFIEADLTAAGRWIRADKAVVPKKLYLLQSELTISLYDSDYMIPYTIMPEDVTDDTITWTSSDKGIATVDSYGCITPISPGDVTITATCYNGVKRSAKLHVVDYENSNVNYPDEFLLNRSSLSLREGQYAKLTPILKPQPCMNGYIQWIVADPDIVSITDAGVVTGLKAGSTTVIAFNLELDQYVSCKITVKKQVKKVKKGARYNISGLRYKVTKTGSKVRTVTCIGRTRKSLKSVRIPDKVKIGGKYYKVTAIGSGAFKKTNIRSVRLGSNLKKIGRNAFKDCKKLTVIRMKAGKYKIYKKLLRKSGLKSKKVKLRKIK